jgi:hypothetical protein
MEASLKNFVLTCAGNETPGLISGQFIKVEKATKRK